MSSNEIDAQTMMSFLQNAMLYGPERETSGITGITAFGSTLYVLYQGEAYSVRLGVGLKIDIARKECLYSALHIMGGREGSDGYNVKKHFERVFEAGQSNGWAMCSGSEMALSCQQSCQRSRWTCYATGAFRLGESRLR